MNEPSDGEALDMPAARCGVSLNGRPCVVQGEHELHQFDDEPLASLTGVPAGVGPKVNPDCPICTGGRGIECAWHFE